MRKRLIIFDMDGTLMDTSEGIIYCYNQIAAQYGKGKKEKKDFYGIIGGTLEDGFLKLYNIEKKYIKEAVDNYRKLYELKGMYLAKIYDGIDILLKNLKNEKYLIAVATLKHEKFAEKMLINAKINMYIDKVFAYDGEEKCTKSFLINKAINYFILQKNEVILIGDSNNDSIGAKKSKIDFIGVTYGFGFRNLNDLVKTNCIFAASNVEQLIEFFGSVKTDII